MSRLELPNRFQVLSGFWPRTGEMVLHLQDIDNKAFQALLGKANKQWLRLKLLTQVGN